MAAAPVGKYFDNFIFVIMENNDLVNVLKSPEYASLLSQGVEHLDYHGTIHPSQPNYWSTIAQDTFRGTVIKDVRVQGDSGVLTNGADVGSTINGSNGDDFIDIANVTMIGDTLEAAGLSWAIYSENYPGNSSYCWNGDSGSEESQAAFNAGTDISGAILNNAGKANRLYKRKHNPFMSFTSINQDTARCTSHVKSFVDWEAAVAADEFPDYVYIVPNQLDDAHDFVLDTNLTADAAAIAYSGEWLKKFLTGVQNSVYLNSRRTLIHVTWDENDYAYYLNGIGAANCTDTASNCPGDTTNNLVYSVLLGSAVSCYEGSTISGFYDHNSIVATLNENWGLTPLKNSDSAKACAWPLKNCPVTSGYVAPAVTTTTASAASGYVAPTNLNSGSLTVGLSAVVVVVLSLIF
ncbi:hypothetical protein HDU82_000806 [Entophlyctis luteolus]|nr:hypothetical protein HDU82_000806 [Entophlyctis luteolus]